MNPSADLTAALLSLAERQPDAPFLSMHGQETMRWSALARQIGTLGARFATWDIRRGDVVVAAADDRARDLTLVAAAPAASSFMLLADSLTKAQYDDLLVRTRARAVIVPADPSHPLARAAAEAAAVRVQAVAGRDGVAGAWSLEPVAPIPARRHPPRANADVALVTATSGTTGAPKLVPLLHRSLMAQADSMGARLALTPADIAWHGVPLHLAFGKRSAFLLCVTRGGSVHCLPESDVAALQSVVEAGPTGYLPLSFAVARELLARLEANRSAVPRGLRFVIVATGAFAQDERERLEAALGAPVLQHYGATEAGSVAIQDLPPKVRCPGGSGRPLDAMLRFVDPAGSDVGEGAVGEILVCGPQVFDGYLDAPEATEAVLVDGAYRTGDLGRIDADGELRIVGRIRDVINRGGEQIAPAEIDDALRGVPGVADAAAFGVPHATLGEEVVAAVVRAAGSNIAAEAILARVRASIGARRTPRQLWFVDALPRNRAGKVLRSELATLARPAAAPTERGTVASSPVAAALGALWAQVLGVTQVAEQDAFRALGGDDERAAALIDLVRAVFDVELPRDAFDGDDATLARMARELEARRAARSSDAPGGAPLSGGPAVSRAGGL